MLWRGVQPSPRLGCTSAPRLTRPALELLPVSLRIHRAVAPAVRDRDDVGLQVLHIGLTGYPLKAGQLGVGQVR